MLLVPGSFWCMSFCTSFSLGQSLLLQSANSGLPFQKVSSNYFFLIYLASFVLPSIFLAFNFISASNYFLPRCLYGIFFKISNLLFLLYCSSFHLALFDFSKFYIQSVLFFSLLYFTNAVFIYLILFSENFHLNISSISMSKIVILNSWLSFQVLQCCTSYLFLRKNDSKTYWLKAAHTSLNFCCSGVWVKL